MGGHADGCTRRCKVLMVLLVLKTLDIQLLSLVHSACCIRRASALCKVH